MSEELERFTGVSDENLVMCVGTQLSKMSFMTRSLWIYTST